MPPKHDREYIAWKIIDLLAANMTAKLAEIKAEKDPLDTARWGRTLTLADPTKYYYGNRTSYPKTYPVVVFVAPSNTAPRADHGKVREDLEYFDLAVSLYSSTGVDNAEENIQARADRYYRAVKEILFADKGILNTVTDSKEIRSPLSDLERSGADLFIAPLLTLEVQVEFTG